jgi:hypothetical protein
VRLPHLSDGKLEPSHHVGLGGDAIVHESGREDLIGAEVHEVPTSS